MKNILLVCSFLALALFATGCTFQSDTSAKKRDAASPGIEGEDAGEGEGPFAEGEGVAPEPAACETLSFCQCRERPDCAVLSEGCLCDCDFHCSGAESCACKCGGGDYLGCGPRGGVDGGPVQPPDDGGPLPDGEDPCALMGAPNFTCCNDDFESFPQCRNGEFYCPPGYDAAPFGSCEGDVGWPDSGPECWNTCDCSPGMVCMSGYCSSAGDVTGTVFCCEYPCPSGAPCEYFDGSYGRCASDVDGGPMDSGPQQGCGDMIGTCQGGYGYWECECASWDANHGDYCASYRSDCRSAIIECCATGTDAGPHPDAGPRPDGGVIPDAGYCISEGEEYNRTGDPNPPPCCPGLMPLPLEAVSPDGDCLLPGCDCFICVWECGDGRCTAGENVCNCPQDCGP